MVHVTRIMFQWCKQEKACNISKYNCHEHSSEFHYYINVLTKTCIGINIQTENRNIHGERPDERPLHQPANGQSFFGERPHHK